MVRFRLHSQRLLASPGDFNEPWINHHLQAPNSLVVGDKVRIFFSTRLKDSEGFTSLPGFFDLLMTDYEKITSHSSSPALDLGQLGSFDRHGVYPSSVIHSRGRYIMAYGGWSRPIAPRFDVSIGIAESLDGEKFSRLYQGPVIGKSPRSSFIQASPKIREFDDLYHIFYIAGESWASNGQRYEPRYLIRHAVSSDLRHWELSDAPIIPQTVPLESQASPDVFDFEGKFYMVFCFRSQTEYFTGAGAYKFGMASSSDLISWDRDDSLLIEDEYRQAWESEMRAYPNMLETNGHYTLFYNGNGVGETGIGMAKIEVVRD